MAIKAPIKYPYNMLAAAANYKLHAGEMFPPGSPQQKAANEADQDKEDPVFFAKSPRSCIIDPGEPFFIPPGRNIDWEGELAIVIGKPALRVTEAPRTTTCSATASCTTSAIAAAPAAGR